MGAIMSNIMSNMAVYVSLAMSQQNEAALLKGKRAPRSGLRSMSVVLNLSGLKMPITTAPRTNEGQVGAGKCGQDIGGTWQHGRH